MELEGREKKTDLKLICLGQSVDFDDEQMISSNMADSQFMRRSAVSQKCQIEKLEPKFKRDVCFSE